MISTSRYLLDCNYNIIFTTFFIITLEHFGLENRFILIIIRIKSVASLMKTCCLYCHFGRFFTKKKVAKANRNPLPSFLPERTTLTVTTAGAVGGVPGAVPVVCEGVGGQRTENTAFMPVNDEHIIIPTGITLLLLDIFRASATESLDVCGGRPETNTLLSLLCTHEVDLPKHFFSVAIHACLRMMSTYPLA